ncbi:hypothetical protein E2C01_092413 [Portunus trituberculatus]|uniref:Uncharacterized protein n=1 Tax=Portunus trituberculatus TaxID=210409 RepID=A0A5B7JK10_PORTR|nr:hypothetical protein [Portunus trituberculatus]
MLMFSEFWVNSCVPQCCSLNR